MIYFKGSHLSIKKNLNQTKKALLEDNQYKKANQDYLNELSKIYGDNVIDLNDSVSETLKNKSEIPENNNGKKNDNVIYLQNEIIRDVESSDNDTIINPIIVCDTDLDGFSIIDLNKEIKAEEEIVDKEVIKEDLIEDKGLETETKNQSTSEINPTEENFDPNTNNDSITTDATDIIENNNQKNHNNR